MTVIGFVRHGVTAWNKEGRIQGAIDIPLDEEGLEMAKELSKRLAGEEWAAIYTSPLQRAHETARIIANNQQLVQVDKRLREIGEGRRAGTTEIERIQQWGTFTHALQLGVEADSQVLKRGMAFIEEMMQTYPNERILVVSHGSFIKRMLMQLCPDRLFEKELDNASLTIVTLNEFNYCELYNCTAHLK